MLHPRFTGAFKRDRKRAGRRGKTLEKLDDLIRRLAREEKLEAHFRDHKLGGEWNDFRECHLELGLVGAAGGTRSGAVPSGSRTSELRAPKTSRRMGVRSGREKVE